jgi:hypothetical protein
LFVFPIAFGNNRDDDTVAGYGRLVHDLTPVTVPSSFALRESSALVLPATPLVRAFTSGAQLARYASLSPLFMAHNNVFNVASGVW